ncbi:TIGR04282 family arsenosugar biosynthesis glycosyltransferase [Marinobacter caseinilyticus]|uniref:TIGR04282 family arsenosugar biosynthesis glycosyltransferase n=1 Tax=Marinobacter caseinilyticus TaxID=2692195 RepID=UPI00140BE0A6|nr:TIGR04282 family arsenosugar biosynthesis glycosyltransferase [Marinobacter caseinilyticus]
MFEISNNVVPTTVLIQFAKWPEAGRVKTRLIPALGVQGALDAHCRLTLTVLGHLLASGRAVEFWWDRALAQPPASARPVVSEVRAASLVENVQMGADLGARMHQALAQSLQTRDKVLIIGSDCPSVDAPYIEAALAALDHSDAVIGPSEDGGYVLLGARRVAEGMLVDIEWGSARVLGQTCERMTACGLTYQLLEPRWDVDEAEDWERFVRQPPA